MWSCFRPGFSLFHLTLTASSVLPGRSFEISAQLFPTFFCSSISTLSSSTLQGSLRPGFSLYHLHLTASSVLPGRSFEISAQLFPTFFCSSISTLSSSLVHPPLLLFLFGAPVLPTTGGNVIASLWLPPAVPA